MREQGTKRTRKLGSKREKTSGRRDKRLWGTGKKRDGARKWGASQVLMESGIPEYEHPVDLDQRNESVETGYVLEMFI